MPPKPTRPAPAKQPARKSKREDVVEAASAIYNILQTHNVPACAIGSTAIVCSTTRPYGRDPNSVDFLTFQNGHNQRSLNELLPTNYPDLFIIQAQKNPSSLLPPLLYYRVPDSRKKLRVFFLPLWTRHTQQNVPVIGIEEAEPKRQSTVPIPPLPFVLYLQMHGWVWNINRLLKSPLNQNARTKRDNFAHDICALLSWAVKKHAHFGWLSEEFNHRLLDAANKFVGGHPETVGDWRALGVNVEAPKPQPGTTNSGKRPAVRYEESKKGTQAMRLLKEQLGDLEYAGAYEYDDDQYISDYTS